MDNGRTAICSVLFLDIFEFRKKSAADQIKLKQSFNRVLFEALDGVAARDRVVLEMNEGAAIAFLGDPGDALFIALAIRDNADLPVRMGVNLGPVRLVKNISGKENIIGDGIDGAQRMMSFSGPGQLLVSSSFYEVVSRLSKDYANLFSREGSRADNHVHQHEVYSAVAGFRGDRGAVEKETPKTARREQPSRTGSPSPTRSRSVTNEDMQPAKIFDAGANLVISGYSRSRVEEALDKLAKAGSRIISPITQVSDKWIASCEHPQAPVSACKVAIIGGKQIVTGPTREAVSMKVEELIQSGSALVNEIALVRGLWTAVCQTGDRNHRW